MTTLTGWTIDDEDEVFVPCPDYPEHFEIGSKGSLKSLRSGRLVSQTPDHKGYLRHATKIGGRNGKAVCIRVHVQVAKAFVPRESDDLEVNHLTADKNKNSYTELEWTTHAENMEHGSAMGLFDKPKGANSPLAALTQEQADEIRSMQGQVSQRELGRRFGVDKTTIKRIHDGVAYLA